MSLSDRSLSRTERLRSLGAVRRLFSAGESGFVFPFRYVWYAEADAQPTVEILFSVPKKYHKRANKRNLLRRRMKECYRLRKAALHFEQGVSLDLALIYSAKERVDYRRIDSAVEKILRKVSEQISAR